MHFLVLFMGLTVPFQLTLTFIYNIFNKKNFQFQQNNRILKRPSRLVFLVSMAVAVVASPLLQFFSCLFHGPMFVHMVECLPKL